MKKFKKLWAMLLAMVMVLAMAVPAFAATITVENAVDGEDYTAYKLFDVAANENETAYSYYTTNKDLKEALETLGLTFDTSADESMYFVKQTKDNNGNTVFAGTNTNMTAADLAAKINSEITKTSSALKTALGDGIEADEDQSGNIVFSDLTAGYYFVDSSLGALCALNTVLDKETIKEKNSVPSIEKKVLEDSDGTYGNSATIDVIDTVYYELTVNTGANTNGEGTGVDDDYVIADELPDYFKYVANSIKVKVGSTEWGANDFTPEYDEDNNTLTITLLSTGKLGSLAQNTDIVITYEALVTANAAVVGGNGNENTATLTYKEQTSVNSATVYTYEIGTEGDETPTFQKVDGNGAALSGVKFILSRTNDEGTVYYATVVNNFLTEWTTVESDASELVTDKNGAINVKGLDAGTYILTETETLDGYNMLEDTITVVIDNEGKVTYKLTKSEGEGQNTIKVENKSGTVLPSTGGMGTRLFYLVGGILVVAAGVLLISRKRMESES